MLIHVAKLIKFCQDGQLIYRTVRYNKGDVKLN